GRTLDAKMGVTPLAGVAGVSLPLFGDAHAAGEADTPVTNQDFTMCPVVVAPKAPGGRAEPQHVDPRLAQGAQEGAAHGLGTVSVEDHLDVDAAPCFRGERAREPLGD